MCKRQQKKEKRFRDRVERARDEIAKDVRELLLETELNGIRGSKKQERIRDKSYIVQEVAKDRRELEMQLNGARGWKRYSFSCQLFDQLDLNLHLDCVVLHLLTYLVC